MFSKDDTILYVDNEDDEVVQEEHINLEIADGDIGRRKNHFSAGSGLNI